MVEWIVDLFSKVIGFDCSTCYLGLFGYSIPFVAFLDLVLWLGLWAFVICLVIGIYKSVFRAFGFGYKKRKEV